MYLYLICKSHILTNLPLPTETHRSNKRAKVYGLTLDPSAKKILRHVLAAEAGATSCCGMEDDYQVLTGQNI